MTEVQKFIYILIGNYIQICLLFLQPFYLLTYRGKHRFAAYWMFTTVSFGVFMLNTHLFSQDEGIRILKLFFNFSWFLVLVMLLFRDSRKRRLIIWAVGIVLMYSSELLSFIFLRSMGLLNFQKGSEYSEGALRGIVFINIISFIMDIYFILFWKRVVEKCRVQGIGLYLSMPIYQFVLLVMFFNQAKNFDIKVAVLGLSMLIMGITINVLMMYFLQEMEQKLEVEEQLSELYRQRQYELEYYQVINSHVEQLREVRHDFVNTIQTVYLLIQGDNTTKQAEGAVESDIQRDSANEACALL